jgi:hypothetical protein
MIPFPFSCHKFCSELGLLYPEAVFRKGRRAERGEWACFKALAMMPPYHDLSLAFAQAPAN